MKHVSATAAVVIAFIAGSIVSMQGAEQPGKRPNLVIMISVDMLS